MEECDHRTQISLLSAKVNRYFLGKSKGKTPELKK